MVAFGERLLVFLVDPEAQTLRSRKMPALGGESSALQHGILRVCDAEFSLLCSQRSVLNCKGDQEIQKYTVGTTLTFWLSVNEPPTSFSNDSNQLFNVREFCFCDNLS